VSQDIAAEVVRRMVEAFPADVETIQAGVTDGRTPEAARLVLAAALTYVGEPIDLVPDSLEGIGLIDDAAILRLAARSAVTFGATDQALHRLASEADDLAYVFGEVVFQLETFLQAIQRGDASGRTPLDVIADPDSRMALWRELTRRRESSRSHALIASAMDAGELARTARTLIRGRLAKAGIE
jgi:uncharacterized membrane protein YkvA (DUF1232 family)